MTFVLRILVLCCLAGASHRVLADQFREEIQPLITKYCLDCHSAVDAKGDVDFSAIMTADQIESSFEMWESAAERLIERAMPPEGKLQPTDIERSRILDWYQQRFVDAVVARPQRFRPRRLSATEYRNTLHSLFGFELEVSIIAAEQTHVEKSLVLKLLPEDPPGRSGFRNDTHGNPLTTVIWEQYSCLADHGLNEFFAPGNREYMEAYVGPMDPEFTETHAEKLLRTFVPRAVRRPVPEIELSEIVAKVLQREQGADLIDSVKAELKTVLMSPTFLYRGLLMKRNPGQHPVDDFELAERLSYFLWGDMPDETLADLAKQGSLSQPSVLVQQVDRMLASPKAKHLAEDFAFQWLAIGEIEHTTDNYPLRQSMTSQVVDFMHYLFNEDRPLLELIDTDTTFINPLLAHYYGTDRSQLEDYRKPKGIEVEFVPLQKIKLKHSEERGGILTMPGILAMNKGPVLRGTWMLERILGDELLDPPMNVGSVPPNRNGESLTFRERFAMHRSNSTCAACHDKIDPLGFALQRFDNAGAYIAPRTTIAAKEKKGPKQDDADAQVDTSGQLPSGEPFDDMNGLKRIFATSKRQVIIRNVVKRTLAYSLCRKLEIHDNPVVDSIVADLDQSNGTYRDLFRQVVLSLPFRETISPVQADSQ